MEPYPRVGANGNVDMVPLQQQVQVQTVGGGSALVLTPTMDNNLPQPLYMLGLGQVMTDEQLETLRRQISVYSTICHQLVEMHKASVSAQSTLAGMVGVRHINYDPLMGTPNHKTTARQRWTPSQNQLQILEKLFDQGNGTPNKTRIREITADLSQHGQIAETNVYNWFQNRKARAKRKQQMVPTKDGDSEVDTDNDSPKEKKPKFDKDSGQEYSNSGGLGETGGHSSDGGGTYEQKPAVIDQYEQESASSGAQMPSQTDSKQSGHTFGRSMSFDQAYGKGVSNNTSVTNNSPLSNTPPMSNMLVDHPSKLVDMPRGVAMDVKSGFDENAIIVDSCGQNVRTEDAGTSLQPLHTRESYRLTTGLGDGVGRTTSGASESMHAHSMQQGVGILNNGLKNGTMVRSQAQG